jgi:hypothetical protein
VKDKQLTQAEPILRPESLPRDHGATSVLRLGVSDGPEPDRRNLECASAEARESFLTRIRELEVETRALRAVLEVRNEAFHALMARLVTMELHAFDDGERLRTLDERVNILSDRLRTVARERDDAVLLANTLHNLKTLRYTRRLRDLYGRIRRGLGL